MARQTERGWLCVVAVILLTAGWCLVAAGQVPATRELVESHLGNRGPAWQPELTPSKLGWGEDAKPHADKFVVNALDSAEMVWVPAGTFKMGSEHGHENEAPVHQVTLDGFWLYKTEVTNAQFALFVEATGYDAGEYWRRYTEGRDQHPVVSVRWGDAQAYAEWVGGRLPTEAEWEYGAGGPEGRVYPWGTDWDAGKCCNWDNKGPGEPPTFPVGSFLPGVSWCGALDLAGNVWEWCADWYGPYEARAARNPQGAEVGSARVLRGGGWPYNAFYCRSACRFKLTPKTKGWYTGFRCAQGL